MAEDSLKSKITHVLAIQRNVFMAGTNNCPLFSDGYKIVSFVQKFSDVASLISVNGPLISA